jgi:Domain of unknown function (DUF4145)
VDIKVENSQPQPNRPVVKLRCPKCRHNGTFEALSAQDLMLYNTGHTVGLRRCPDPACYALLFFAARAGQEEFYPPETIDFDATNVPAPVQSALEEAIKCHAQLCFVASAIMVRKTMEELCADRKAEGANLKERIASLGTKVILPKELLEGLDGLRLLGNDAAHIESNVYKDVGREEVEIGIEVTKEVLKAVYQYAALIAKLNARKINPPPLPQA